MLGTTQVGYSLGCVFDGCGFHPGFLQPSSSVNGLTCQHDASCLATDSHAWIPLSSLAPDCPRQCGEGPVQIPWLKCLGRPEAADGESCPIF